MKKYNVIPEIILNGIDGHFNVPEITLSYKEGRKFSGKLTDVYDVADFIRSIYPEGEIDLQEHFIALYVNAQGEVKAYYHASKGGITSTIADPRLILGAALKCAATGIILAHNHPSGNLSPSRNDLILTDKIKKGAHYMDITLVEHLIITKDSHKSLAGYANVGLPGLNSLKGRNGFEAKIEQDLSTGIRHDKRSIEKLAATYGLTDKTEIKELTELAIVNRARFLAHEPGTQQERFDSIVKLYELQVNLSHRTSQSILLQQYSTPAPIGYLAGIFCEVDKYPLTKVFFEPSAGNGLLTIAGKTKNFIVNEIDDLRNRNLHKQNYLKITKEDATNPFTEYYHKFDAVLTNPPFGKAENKVAFNQYPIKLLEHLMAIRALECMKDGGRAAIIIGGHTRWDSEKRIQAGNNRIFFNYLYHHYNIADVINIDGAKLYSRQGTAFDVRLILINGRKKKPSGAAPLFNEISATVITTFTDLFNRVTTAKNLTFAEHDDMNNLPELELEAEDIMALFADDLGAPYIPVSSGRSLETQVPDSMSFETQQALERIKIEVGGNIDRFVKHRLKYTTLFALQQALSAEQIDAVAMAIYNIEARNQGMIIGDQTGIGKGRIAAAMIRYGVMQGIKPIFITEKANLFSDIYRDLSAIGSAHLKPFIVNGREPKTDIKDEDGEVVYQALPAHQQQDIFITRKIPAEYDFVVATYSQFNSPEKKPEKPMFLWEVANDNLIILDEAHNSSGSSNTGSYLQNVVALTRGVVFLSATFAKRPDNMPIYAMKTAMCDANLTKQELVDAIIKGGVALQEILSSQLVAEGQMIRRERSFEGVEVNYITLDEMTEEHSAIADNITAILRDIIAFQKNHIDKQVEDLDKIAAAEGKEVDLRQGTSQAGVDNTPYFSKIFQVINQMLFSIKAAAVAERAIMRLNEGKKPVIAFASTMGSFIEQMENEFGMPVSEGDVISADFAEVLRRGLDGVLRYSERDVTGEMIHKKFSIGDLSEAGKADYYSIYNRIEKISTGITISPIDIIIHKITQAGYTVAEVTGRKLEVQINPKTNQGIIMNRKRINTNDAFRHFNNNEVDVLLINQSGSTGASAHAIPTNKVPAGKIKQRVMIVLQAELDINTEVQKRGRINRTGQLLKPIYDYVSSAIPAEKRLMMMLQKKLKSLDANTTSNQKNSSKILDVPDFLNKYGDKVVKEYLLENPEINNLLDDPLHLNDSESDSGRDSGETLENAAHKVSGRVAVLTTKMQQEFYNEIIERYNDYVTYLKQVDEYDLEVEAMNLEAETISRRVFKMGKGGDSSFGDDSMLETIKANVLRKPFTKTELDNLLNEACAGNPGVVREKLIADYEQYTTQKLEETVKETNDKYDRLIEEIPQEKKVQKILESDGQSAFLAALKQRETELNHARQLKLVEVEQTSNNRKQYLLRFFKFFYTGRLLNYPAESYDSGKELIPAVFIGFAIDQKKKNPFAPSAIKLRIAIASGYKFLALPASYSTDIMSIIGASNDLEQPSRNQMLNDWETIIKNSHTDRKNRFVITGNLLQASADGKGKLVSYTTKQGETKKGILMPDNWIPSVEMQEMVVVPVFKALPLIKSMIVGSNMQLNKGISFIRLQENYKIIVPASREKGGDIYLDREILELVEKNIFEKVSDKMVAILPVRNIQELIRLLQDNHSCSITVDQKEFSLIADRKAVPVSRKKIDLPPDEIETPINMRLLELEAEALSLELELLNLAA